MPAEGQYAEGQLAEGILPDENTGIISSTFVSNPSNSGGQYAEGQFPDDFIPDSNTGTTSISPVFLAPLVLIRLAVPPSSYNSRHRRSMIWTTINNQIVRTGRWLIYIRRDIRFPCKCYDPIAGIPSIGDCPLCFGTGYRVSIERVKSAYQQSPSYLPGLNSNEGGFADSYPATLMMRSLYLPSELDLVLEVEWNVPYPAVPSIGVPTRVVAVWRIQRLFSIVTEANGEPDFFGAGLEIHPFSVSIVQQTLRSQGSRIVTNAVQEDLSLSQRSPKAWTPSSSGQGDRYQQRDMPDSQRSITGRGLGYASRRHRPGL